MKKFKQEKNDRSTGIQSPNKTELKGYNQASEVNETNFDIEMSHEKGLVVLDFDHNNTKTRDNSKLRLQSDLEEQKNSGPPSSQPIKSKKALDTLATANFDMLSNHEVMTQDNLATINENPEILN